MKKLAFVALNLTFVALAATVVALVAPLTWRSLADPVALLDKQGWIPHRQAVATYVGQSGWMPGEYRNCIGEPTTEGKLSPIRGPGGVFGGVLACDQEGHATEDPRQVIAHEFDVTFWGRVERPEMMWGSKGEHWFDWELKRRNAICAEDPKAQQERTARKDLCDEENHIGKIPEWRWRCRRNESSLTCWAVN